MTVLDPNVSIHVIATDKPHARWHRTNRVSVSGTKEQPNDEEMQRRRCAVSLGLLTAFLGGALAGSCAGKVSPATLTPVAIWRIGDDGLTLRFTDALKAAFQASSQFSEGRSKQPGTLIVTVADHVAWKEVGRRVRVSYRVTYSDAAERPLGTAKGRCWEDELSKCAAEVVTRAGAAARKLR